MIESDLAMLSISDCPELEELPFSTCQTCSAKISIVRCGKLQNITLPVKLVELEIEECRELRTVTAICDTSDCLELQDLSSVARLSCLKRITIRTCERLQTIQGIDDFHALESLHLFDCPELEKLPFSTCQTCLAKVSIVRCGRLQNIILPAKLVELEIEECRELRTVTAICDTSDCLELQDLSSVARLSCLKRITIRTCERLQTIQGIDDFHALESLHLFDCPELEKLPFSTCQTCLAKVSIVRCGRLQNITLPAKLVELEILECCLKRITIRTCEKLQTTQGIDDFHALESLHLFDCPELEELAFSTCQSCPAKISIVKCGKLQSITLPAKLVELEREKCRELRTVTAICDTSDCLELQDLSSVARLSCLKRITIWTCERLQTIQGIDDFHALESLHLFDCPELEKLPFSTCQTCLAEVSIVRCGRLQNITLPAKLVELEIEKCRELRTVTAICDTSDCLELQDLSSVARLSCLKRITIRTCERLQTIQGIDDFHALESLHLFDCPELEKLPFSTCQTCLAEVSIVRCGRLQNITLPAKLVELEILECCLKRITIRTCEKLQTTQGIDDFHALESLHLFDCPELEELAFSTCQSYPAKISIVKCGKLQSITLPAKLVELEIEKCRELRTVTAICDTSDCLELQDFSSVSRLSCLKCITIQYCEQLQTIQGIDDFHALESLHLIDCPKLEELPFSICQTYLAQIRIVSCGKLQNITLPTKLVELEIKGCGELRTVTAICDPSDCLELQDLSSVARLSCLKCITIEDCKELQIIQGIGELHALESLHLLDCPKLEELPFSTCQTCLAKISIVRCGKLQNITLPTKLVVLEIQECEELKTVTLVCDPSESLEIQELSSVARLSCVQRISIQACEELQIIQGIGELHALNLMQLSCCSNATIRNCIHMLKSLPSKLLVVIGRAVNGALSTLKSPLFSDADAAIEDIITPTIMAELSAVILCFVVGPNSCTLHDLILFFTCCDLDWWSGFRADCWWPLAQGEWLVTVVITDEDMLESCDDSLQKYGEVKYGKKVCIKKGEEWKTLPMLCTIIDRLY
ncbi:protein SUPPRESSOR OF npr1-1, CONSTITUTIVE 1-like [Cryptomeria japonica]|uniref:protein SUPPRESSOR OF npr1-1, CONSTITUTIVE 1-like n=1 Tax=Cryptomeria japonica TaxID=3369 RepID=UPI0027DAB0AC|nr:protein SUPPRESSOR OF npr1-1, CONSTITUTIVE 1-like [Cryptomeria japonica]